VAFPQAHSYLPLDGGGLGWGCKTFIVINNLFIYPPLYPLPPGEGKYVVGEHRTTPFTPFHQQAFNQSWYDYCLRIGALKKKKIHCFQVYMFFFA
jgi:hypothetical protein